MKLSNLADNITTSPILTFAASVNNKIANNPNDRIYNLTVGDFNSNIYPIPNELKAGIKAAIDNNHINEFKLNIADASFLFKHDVTNYLQLILRKSTELKKHQTDLRSTNDKSKKSEFIDKEHQVLLWFTDELNNFQTPFMPYMGMQD